MSAEPLHHHHDPATTQPAHQGVQLRLRLPWLFAALVLLGGLAYSHAWATEPLRLPDGRVFQVLNFDRHTSYSLGRDGSRQQEQYFWVRYYTNASAPDSVSQEARHLAAALYIGYYVYSPIWEHPLLRNIGRFVALPIITIAGLWMWRVPSARATMSLT